MRAAAAAAAAATAPAAAAAAAGSAAAQADPQEVVELRAMVAETEQRFTELLVKHTIAEEELRNYQAYMRTSLGRYQREILELKKASTWWREQALDAGVQAQPPQ